MSNEPNPFDPDGRKPWLRIYFNSQLALAALTKVDGVSTEDTWKDQPSKEKSGMVKVFSGTKKGNPKLTFLCHDKASYAWLQTHWEMLKPVPTASGGAANPTPTAPTGGTQYMAASQVKPGTVGSVPAPGKSDTVDGSANSSDAGASTKATTNPGPKPPTIPVDYPSLQRHGITAVARGKWTDVGFTATNGYEVEIEYVAQDPPKPAGTGALTPATPAAQGQQFSGGAPAQPGQGSPAAAQAGGV